MFREHDRGQVPGEFCSLEEFDRIPVAWEAPPAFLTLAASRAYAVREREATLAWLTWDSETDSVLLGDQQQLGGSRTLTFEGEALIVDLEIGPALSGRPFGGRVRPAGPVRLQVMRVGSAPVELPVDALGRFAAPRCPRGLVRLRVQRPGVPVTVTSWIRIS